MENKRSAWEKFTNTKVIKTLKEYWGADDWIALGIALAGALYYWKNDPLLYHPGWHEFYEKIHAELIGIGITVLILGNANQAIRIKQEKRRLILQMGSTDNSFAREAVRQLRARGWLQDGTTKGASLRRANLERADLCDADLEGADLSGVYLKGADLSGAYLEEADLSGAYLEEAYLFGAHLERAYLTEAKLERANLRWAHLEGANLRGAYLEWAYLIETHLEGADLEEAHMEGVNLIRAHMEEAHLEGADLIKAHLNKTCLEGADLSWTYLMGAKLKEVMYDDKTIWTEAKYNKDTLWPEGFDPEAAGAVLVEDE